MSYNPETQLYNPQKHSLYLRPYEILRGFSWGILKKQKQKAKTKNKIKPLEVHVRSCILKQDSTENPRI